MNDVNICGRLLGVTGNGYHHGALRRALLDAAVEEARRNGPDGVQIRALAKAVGVSPSAAYRHFPNIEALLAEVSQFAREELARFLIDRRDRATQLESPTRRTRKVTARKQFRAVGRAYIDFACAEPHLFDTAFGPGIAPPRPDDPSAWEVLVGGVQTLTDTGAIESTATDQAALIAWSGVHGIASILVRQALVGPLDGDAAIETVLDGIMRALESL